LLSRRGGTVLGPTLGGWLTETYSWRWAFHINIPVGIQAVILIGRFVEDPPYIKNAKAGKLDRIGLGLLAVWLGALQIVLDKGREDDCFGAIWIRWAVVIMVIGFVAFLYRELTYDKPLVRLNVFKNRNFAVGCVLIFLFGGVIYGLVTLLPLFFQELLGYTALAAGLAVSPRGLGSLFFMPVIGILTDRVDNRLLVLRIHLHRALLPRVRALRLGDFPVVASLAYRFQRRIRQPHLCTAGGGYHGYFAERRDRQRQRPLQPHAQCRRQHRHLAREYNPREARTGTSNYLVYAITNASPTFQQQYQAVWAFVTQQNGLTTAGRQAYKLFERSVDQQAALLSYVDDFRYIAFLCFFCAPIAFAMKRVRGRGKASMAH
jgi:DHA2 family multidrug resistance protein